MSNLAQSLGVPPGLSDGLKWSKVGLQIRRNKHGLQFCILVVARLFILFWQSQLTLAVPVNNALKQYEHIHDHTYGLSQNPCIADDFYACHFCFWS